MDRLDTLAVFVAVAEQGGFAAAARLLQRSPAAVTRAVADLEDRLKVRLLQRTTRAVSLTEAGQRALESARRILAGMEELDAVTEDVAALHGSVAVTAPTMFGRLHVLRLVQGFLVQHPGVAVRLMLLDRVVSLADEGLDLAVRIGALPDSALRATRLGEVQEGIYASPAYLAAHGRPEAPRDLAGHAVIACTALAPVPDRWTFPGAAVVVVAPRLVVNTPDAAVDAAVAGLGLANLVSYQAAAHVAAGRLRRVLSAHAPPPEPVHLVYAPTRHLSRRVRLLLDHLADGLRRDCAAIARMATE
ncbi:LysR family transcriptional regulator [Neoroseomonas oryzicola]|uniref:LysR family transcriptional regulator n=1 Tax=Neoroseomonas oryzicola TaxID=535904 RepID=A0A9X9WJ89_9PROT|nr:LysR family transcriptional regulator [Neoroseomonas oryzicola]MBR0660399.1 LysR family transcriptional regulator [Neoroseomonas oryzicola]NKE17349.1 LysR family transcriptional regulator [Neoroseomonas oryzicola]